MALRHRRRAFVNQALGLDRPASIANAFLLYFYHEYLEQNRLYA